MRKPTYCICENKGADSLHGKYNNSPTFYIQNFQPFVLVQLGVEPVRKPCFFFHDAVHEVNNILTNLHL